VTLHFTERYVAEVRDHAKGRLCRGDGHDLDRLKERARAHQLIFAHAKRAGIPPATPERQRFARELFLLSRQCGAAGLGEASRELFELAKEATGGARAGGLDFRLYAMAARLLGWPIVGRLACASDRFRG
jgi:hypothetical protein